MDHQIHKSSIILSNHTPHITHIINFNDTFYTIKPTYYLTLPLVPVRQLANTSEDPPCTAAFLYLLYETTLILFISIFYELSKLWNTPTT